jgi:hypothetical protein
MFVNVRVFGLGLGFPNNLIMFIYYVYITNI